MGKLLRRKESEKGKGKRTQRSYALVTTDTTPWRNLSPHNPSPPQ